MRCHLTIWSIFYENCMKMKKFSHREGVRPLRPLQDATAWDRYYSPRYSISLLISFVVYQEPFVVSDFSMTPESPRWLLSKMNLDEADQVIRRIVLINKKELPKDFNVRNIKAVCYLFLNVLKTSTVNLSQMSSNQSVRNHLIYHFD